MHNHPALCSKRRPRRRWQRRHPQRAAEHHLPRAHYPSRICGHKAKIASPFCVPLTLGLNPVTTGTFRRCPRHGDLRIRPDWTADNFEAHLEDNTSQGGVSSGGRSEEDRPGAMQRTILMERRKSSRSSNSSRASSISSHPWTTKAGADRWRRLRRQLLNSCLPIRARVHVHGEITNNLRVQLRGRNIALISEFYQRRKGSLATARHFSGNVGVSKRKCIASATTPRIEAQLLSATTTRWTSARISVTRGPAFHLRPNYRDKKLVAATCKPRPHGASHISTNSA